MLRHGRICSIEHINSLLDHGLLLGLTGDDHAQYLLTDGTRDLTDDWTISTNSITLTAGTLTADTLTDGTLTITGGDLATAGDITCDELTLTAPTDQDYKFTCDSTGELALQGQTDDVDVRLNFYTKKGDDNASIFWTMHKLGTLASLTHSERLVIWGAKGGDWHITSDADGDGTLRDLTLGISATHLVLNADGTSSFGGDLDVSGDITATTSSVKALLIEQAGGTDIFWVDTTNRYVYIDTTLRMQEYGTIMFKQDAAGEVYRHVLKKGSAGSVGDSDLVCLCNRIANGEVAIMANVAAGAAGEVEVARFADDLITLKQDVIFTGTAGLPYGEISAYNAADTIAITTAGIANKVQITSFDTNGASNNSTPDHTNDHITITTAGHYFCVVSLHIESAGGGGADTFGFGVYKNNGTTLFQNCHGHRKLAGGGGDVGAITMSGIIDLAVNDTIELWTWNEDSTDNLVVQDVTLSFLQVGGT